VLSRKWFAMGHSQGGQTALFTAAVASQEAPNLKFMGAVAIAPANGFAVLADAVKAANPLAQGALPFLPLIMLGISAASAVAVSGSPGVIESDSHIAHLMQRSIGLTRSGPRNCAASGAAVCPPGREDARQSLIQSWRVPW
jgi:hypothetical protein